jgi:hypothetical protein
MGDPAVNVLVLDFLEANYPKAAKRFREEADLDQPSCHKRFGATATLSSVVQLPVAAVATNGGDNTPQRPSGGPRNSTGPRNSGGSAGKPYQRFQRIDATKVDFYHDRLKDNSPGQEATSFRQNQLMMAVRGKEFNKHKQKNKAKLYAAGVDQNVRSFKFDD